MVEDEMTGFMAGMAAERTRMARDLHDTLLQSLAGLALQIGGLSKVVTSESGKRHLRRLRAQADECLREAREAIWNMRKAGSQSLDLAAELRASGERLNAVDFSVEGKPKCIPINLGEHLLRIGREAMTNAARHSRAERVRVRLGYGTDSIHLQVVDNGRGFNLDEGRPGHFGLTGMRERTERIQGSIAITSELSHGTSVHVTVSNPRDTA
jgi:signal transduction histidine kinase